MSHKKKLSLGLEQKIYRLFEFCSKKLFYMTPREGNLFRSFQEFFSARGYLSSRQIEVLENFEKKLEPKKGPPVKVYSKLEIPSVTSPLNRRKKRKMSLREIQRSPVISVRRKVDYSKIKLLSLPEARILLRRLSEDIPEDIETWEAEARTELVHSLADEKDMRSECVEELQKFRKRFPAKVLGEASVQESN